MVNEQLLNRSIKFLLFYVLLITALFYGKPFLVPLIIAALLAMLLLPVSQKLENKGWNKGVSIIACLLILIFVISIIVGLLAWQVSDMAKDAAQIEKNFTEKIQQVKQLIATTFGIPQEKQQQIINDQEQSVPGKLSSMITTTLASVGGLFAHFILVLVYIFLFLFYRGHLKTFLTRIVPKQDQGNTREIVESCRQVAQKYLTGLAFMISILWVMYSIGFSIAGVQNGVFFAILCGLLEIVPFIGNLVGVTITLFMSMAQGGGSTMLVGILITYGIVQFVQTYLLEPLVVGRGVDINPLFTIVGLVAGEIIWGIPGMVLAIPLLAIIKIICDHIEQLKPYGALIGEDKKEKDTGGENKVKRVFQKKTKD